MRIEPVLKGKQATFKCREGIGYIGRVAEQDGLNIWDDGTVTFLPLHEARKALAQLRAERKASRGFSHQNG